MKKLRDYMHFDAEGFLKGKLLAFMGGKMSEPTKEHPDAFKGALIDVVILNDPQGVNDYQRFRVKVPDADEAYLKSFKTHDQIMVVNIQKSVVYGDYQNELSITGRVVKTPQK